MLPHRAVINRCLDVICIEHELLIGFSANTQKLNAIVI